ncbi:hypothetical protein LZ32DRAFT_607877 [Colletotrichum eremochloae]|nr:hypothetical protein LZ32DRAFT_607877 [Colletotrichum eremochloae]
MPSSHVLGLSFRPALLCLSVQVPRSLPWQCLALNECLLWRNSLGTLIIVLIAGAKRSHSLESSVCTPTAALTRDETLIAPKSYVFLGLLRLPELT